jgi:riboflavin transporter FmnP
MIQTFTLVIMTLQYGIALPNYGSAAECEAARKVVVTTAAPQLPFRTIAAFCIPSPVEAAR